MQRTRLRVHNKRILTDIDFKVWLADRPDGDYIVEVDTEANKTRSQLGYYFGCLIPLIVDWAGYSKTEADHHMRVEFLDSEKMTHRGNEYVFIPPMKDLNKTKMSKFIQDVFEFCVTHNLNPPLNQEY